MIKAIIFDCFGVLAAEGWKPFVKKHFGTSGEQHNWANSRMHEVSLGTISSEKLVEEIVEATGVDEEAFLSELRTNPPDLELFEYIKTLKQTYKIGFLSNVGHDRLTELFTAEQLALFDATVLSYALKIAKPDPEIYLHTVKLLGVKPSECVFVDDTPRYCKGAEKVGMQAICYTDARSFKQQLEAVL